MAQPAVHFEAALLRADNEQILASTRPTPQSWNHAYRTCRAGQHSPCIHSNHRGGCGGRGRDCEVYVAFGLRIACRCGAHHPAARLGTTLLRTLRSVIPDREPEGFNHRHVRKSTMAAEAVTRARLYK